MEQSTAAQSGMIGPIGLVAGLAFPGALCAWLAFHEGGYFAGATATAAVILAIALAVRIALYPRPLRTVTPALAVAVGGLAAYAAWTAVSAGWGDSTARALIEYDRALLYVLALALAGSVARSPERLRWMLRGVALAIGVVCVLAFLSRVKPSLVDAPLAFEPERLAYPLTYWNALGLVAALGLVLCAFLSCDDEEPPAARVAATALAPIMAVTLMFTFSRGGVIWAVLGVLVYVAAARPRTAVTGLLPGAIAAIVAARIGYDVDSLATGPARTPEAVDDGNGLLATVLLCCAVAAGVRAALLPVDRRLAGYRLALAERTRRLATVGMAVGAVVVAAGLVVALDVPGKIDSFLSDDQGILLQGGDPRERLSQSSSNGRVDIWKVAQREFEAQPLRGTGAGTFALWWSRFREIDQPVYDAHSLYLETLGELGVVGLILLLIPIGALLAAAVVRVRGPNRGPAAAILAVLVAWAIAAGLDWHWEMPAVTAWVLALGGALAAERAGKTVRGAPAADLRATLTRVGVAVGLLALAFLPLQMARSQAALDRAGEAFERDDCRTAAAEAADAIDLLSLRPEPWELLAFCQVERGAYRPAIASMTRAVEEDPFNARLYYGLALVRAVARQDPRSAARRALELDPRNPLASAAVRAFAGEAPARWRRAALRLPLDRR